MSAVREDLLTIALVLVGLPLTLVGALWVESATVSLLGLICVTVGVVRSKLAPER